MAAKMTTPTGWLRASAVAFALSLTAASADTTATKANERARQQPRVLSGGQQRTAPAAREADAGRLRILGGGRVDEGAARRLGGAPVNLGQRSEANPFSNRRLGGGVLSGGGALGGVNLGREPAGVLGGTRVGPIGQPGQVLGGRNLPGTLRNGGVLGQPGTTITNHGGVLRQPGTTITSPGITSPGITNPGGALGSNPAFTGRVLTGGAPTPGGVLGGNRARPGQEASVRADGNPAVREGPPQVQKPAPQAQKSAPQAQTSRSRAGSALSGRTSQERPAPRQNSAGSVLGGRQRSSNSVTPPTGGVQHSPPLRPSSPARPQPTPGGGLTRDPLVDPGRAIGGDRRNPGLSIGNGNRPGPGRVVGGGDRRDDGLRPDRRSRVGIVLGHGDRKPRFQLRSPRIWVPKVYYPHYRFYPSPVYVTTPIYSWVYSYYIGVPTYIEPTRVIVLNNYQRERVVFADDDVEYYYLTPTSKTSLEEAKDNIRQAWKLGDVDLLLKHLRSDRKVHVFLRGKYSYSVEAEDYRDMTKDALQAIETIGFEWVRTRKRSDTEYVCAARHEFRDKDGDTRSVYASYTLEKFHGNWWVTEVGTAEELTDPIHE